jgi:hypothetical protein
MKRFLLAAFILSVSCTQHAKRPSPEVTFKNRLLLYKEEPFSGILEERFEQVATTRKTRYYEGLRQGTEEEFFDNGQIASRREYAKGKKVGSHEGWFSDGKRRFHHEFANGRSHGEVWEWYNSGALATYARFDKGRLLGKKVWRESGQIYMNYVFPENRSVGVPGTKLCYQVRDKKTSSQMTPKKEAQSPIDRANAFQP